MSAEERDRFEDLLALRATEGLATAEHDELTTLRFEHPDWDEEGFDLAAAALQLAFLEPEPMPAGLRQRVRSQAELHFAPAPVVRSRRGVPAWMAIAASLAMVVLGWWALRPAPAPSLADQRAQLVATAPDLVRLEWTATEDPTAVGATGDVVWSDARQSGFMRFHGLAINDPTQLQYQLWVFDAERDERYPVDGGVFDVEGGTEEVLVPIDVKLPVHHAVLFAVTVERSGGVVVSSRERIAVLAQL